MNVMSQEGFFVIPSNMRVRGSQNRAGFSTKELSSIKQGMVRVWKGAKVMYGLKD